MLMDTMKLTGKEKNKKHETFHQCMRSNNTETLSSKFHDSSTVLPQRKGAFSSSVSQLQRFSTRLDK